MCREHAARALLVCVAAQAAGSPDRRLAFERMMKVSSKLVTSRRRFEGLGCFGQTLHATTETAFPIGNTPRTAYFLKFFLKAYGSPIAPPGRASEHSAPPYVQAHWGGDNKNTEHA